VIDTTKEEPISLEQAARLVGHARGETRVSRQTLYRWASSGLRGVRLETVQVGGKKSTSREALDRFFRALTMASDPATNTSVQATDGPAATRSRDGKRGQRPIARDQGYAAASEALDTLGL